MKYLILFTNGNSNYVYMNWLLLVNRSLNL